MTQHSQTRTVIGQLFLGLPLACWLWAGAQVLAAPVGNVKGAVTDAAGAPFPGVRLSLYNLLTGAERHGVSDAQGRIQFRRLAPARWVLTAEAPGCRRLLLPVEVQVGQTTGVEFAMQLGAVTEVLEAPARAPRLAQDQATRSTVVEGRTLAALPLNGRQFLDVALLTPGVLPTASSTQGNGFSVAGARSQSNVYLLDGLSHQDTQQNDALNQFRLTDAVQEFAVQTSVASAEFGRGSGAQINIVTKTGSDHFHGSAFEYFRDPRLNAADFFTNKLGGQQSELRRNQFGATLGGPLRPGQTFYFASYEGFRQRARRAFNPGADVGRTRQRDRPDCQTPAGFLAAAQRNGEGQLLRQRAKHG
jgi:hypothetical protein